MSRLTEELGIPEGVLEKMSVKELMVFLHNAKETEMVTIPLKKYKKMKAEIESLEDNNKYLRAINFPRLKVEYSIRPEDLLIQEFGPVKLEKTFAFDVDAAIPKDDPRFAEIWAILKDAVSKVKEGDKSSRAMINGLRKATEDYREQLKRVPWYLRWAIKPEKKIDGTMKVRQVTPEDNDESFGVVEE